MRIISCLLLLAILGCQNQERNEEPPFQELYPVYKNGLWGFINKEGEVRIKPKFHEIGIFEEGLAPARINGHYGFIDKSGQFVVEPRFDYALPFHNNHARIFIGEKSYVINKTGQILFEHDFVSISNFKNGVAVVESKGHTYGLINDKGILLADTIYKEILMHENGLSIVTGKNHNPYPKENNNATYEIGLIDHQGNTILDFGQYNHISEFENGFSRVFFKNSPEIDSQMYMVMVDSTGTLRFNIPIRSWFVSGEFQEGLAEIDIYVEENHKSGSGMNTYKGYINTAGEVVFHDKNWEEVTAFKNKRAFVKNGENEWKLINNKGQFVSDSSYKDILFSYSQSGSENLFEDNIEFVKSGSGWCGIDTNGLIVMQVGRIPSLNKIYRSGNIILFRQDHFDEQAGYTGLFGFWNISTGTLVKPRFEVLAISDFDNEIMVGSENGHVVYIDQDGHQIWKSELSSITDKPVPFNITYLNRGYFYASSREDLQDHEISNGWGSSINCFKKTFNSYLFQSDQLNLVVDPLKKTRFSGFYSGMKLYLANHTQDTIYFDAQDSRLYLIMQAKDSTGIWKDIEYLPSSWCGNSYHTKFLPPGYSWDFNIPVYEGEIRTKLRAKLWYKLNAFQESDSILYSNEFNGSINPGQFWRKEEYFPSGMMDPYFE